MSFHPNYRIEYLPATGPVLELQRHPFRFYTYMIIFIPFVLAYAVIPFWMARHTFPHIFLAGLAWLLMGIGILYIYYRYLKCMYRSVPGLRVDTTHDRLIFRHAHYHLNELTEWEYFAHEELSCSPFFKLYGIRMYFRDGTQRFFPDFYYTNLWMIKQFIEQRKQGKPFRPYVIKGFPKKIPPGEPFTYYGRTYTSFEHIISWIFFAVFLYLFIQAGDSPRSFVKEMIEAFLMTVFTYFIFWKNFWYFGLSPRFLVIRHLLFLRKPKIYPLETIRFIGWRTFGRGYLLMAVFTSDFRPHCLVTEGIPEKQRQALIQALQESGIPAEDFYM